jgi:hypothetical protein
MEVLIQLLSMYYNFSLSGAEQISYAAPSGCRTTKIKTGLKPYRLPTSLKLVFFVKKNIKL